MGREGSGHVMKGVFHATLIAYDAGVLRSLCQHQTEQDQLLVSQLLTLVGRLLRRLGRLTGLRFAEQPRIRKSPISECEAGRRNVGR